MSQFLHIVPYNFLPWGTHPFQTPINQLIRSTCILSGPSCSQIVYSKDASEVNISDDFGGRGQVLALSGAHHQEFVAHKSLHVVYIGQYLLMYAHKMSPVLNT